MSLKLFNERGLFFNTNFFSASSQANMMGFRGDLVLLEGEKDEKGHAKQPLEVLSGAIVLEKDEKLVLIIGSLDEIGTLPLLMEKYKPFFSDNVKILLYVVNITQPMQVTVDGVALVLIPMVQGIPWNEVIEELGLEKSDFKGQSAADKIITIYKEFDSYKPKYPSATLEEALAATRNVKRETWGAV